MKSLSTLDKAEDVSERTEISFLVFFKQTKIKALQQAQLRCAYRWSKH